MKAPTAAGNRTSAATSRTSSPGTCAAPSATNPQCDTPSTEWSVRIGPTAIYGRRVELGYPGGTGPGHQATRPYPYMEPAARDNYHKVEEIVAANWLKAIGGK